MSADTPIPMQKGIKRMLSQKIADFVSVESFYRHPNLNQGLAPQPRPPFGQYNMAVHTPSPMQSLQRYNKSMPPTSEKLRVSTITAQGLLGVGLSINFKNVYENLQTADEPAHMAIQMIKYTDTSDGSSHQRGVHPRKHRVRVNKQGVVQTLRNQITIVMWLYDPSIEQLHHVSVKLFTNGRVHIAGLRDPELGPLVIQSIAKAIWNCGPENVHKMVGGGRGGGGDDPNNLDGDTHNSVVALPGLYMELEDARRYFSIIMVNSDFKVPFYIKCALLPPIIRASGSHAFYEQDTGAGVKVKFECHPHGENPKIITIMVCRTGSVIITGASSMAQVPIAYNYIRDILFEHRETLEFRICDPSKMV